MSFLLNAMLLFVVAFYVYPLKFLFTTFTNAFTGYHELDAAGHVIPAMQGADWPLMEIYSAGFIALYGDLRAALPSCISPARRIGAEPDGDLRDSWRGAGECVDDRHRDAGAVIGVFQSAAILRLVLCAHRAVANVARLRAWEGASSLL